MNIDALTDNWALWAATIPALLAAVSLVFILARRSSAGKLRHVLKAHRLAVGELAEARKSAGKAEALVRKLSGRAEKVRPRILEEAKEALADARALLKIADDKEQVAVNHVRRVIYEEFPPTRHEKLRQKHLPQDIRDNRPFSF